MTSGTSRERIPSVMRQNELVGVGNPSDQNSNKLPFLKRVGIGALAVGVATGSALGLTGCYPTSAQGNETSPPASAPETPGVEPTSEPSETQAPTETATPSSNETEKTHEQIVAELEIPTGLSPEQYSEAFLDRLHTWNFAGATEEHWEKVYNDYSLTLDEQFALDDTQALEQSQIFREALFIPNPSSTEVSIPEYVDTWQQNNAVTLSQWGWNHNRPGYPDYEESFQLTDVLVVDGYEDTEGRRLIIQGTEHNNWDEIESDITKSQKRDGTAFEFRINTQFIDGKEKISHIGTLVLPDKVNGEIIPSDK